MDLEGKYFVVMGEKGPRAPIELVLNTLFDLLSVNVLLSRFLNYYIKDQS